MDQPRLEQAAPLHTAHIYHVAVLRAIAEIESGNKPKRIGKRGEFTRYQILPRTWRYFAYNSPPTDANARIVVRRILDDYIWHFNADSGRPLDIKDVYVLYNGGPDYYKRRGYKYERVHRVIRERAERFENLVNAFAQGE
jgi:hypothetical protein